MEPRFFSRRKFFSRYKIKIFQSTKMPLTSPLSIFDFVIFKMQGYQRLTFCSLA
jgi:hypothetical protein